MCIKGRNFVSNFSQAVTLHYYILLICIHLGAVVCGSVHCMPPAFCSSKMVQRSQAPLSVVCSILRRASSRERFDRVPSRPRFPLLAVCVVCTSVCCRQPHSVYSSTSQLGSAHSSRISCLHFLLVTQFPSAALHLNQPCPKISYTCTCMQAPAQIILIQPCS